MAEGYPIPEGFFSGAAGITGEKDGIQLRDLLNNLYATPPVAPSSFPYDVQPTDRTVLAPGGGSVSRVNLPTAVGCAGRRITVKRTETGLSTVDVYPQSGEEIDNNGTGNPVSLGVVNFLEAESDGTKWWIVSSDID